MGRTLRVVGGACLRGRTRLRTTWDARKFLQSLYKSYALIDLSSGFRCFRIPDSSDSCTQVACTTLPMKIKRFCRLEIQVNSIDYSDVGRLQGSSIFVHIHNAFHFLIFSFTLPVLFSVAWICCSMKWELVWPALPGEWRSSLPFLRAKKLLFAPNSGTSANKYRPTGGSLGSELSQSADDRIMSKLIWKILDSSISAIDQLGALECFSLQGV